MSSAKLAAAAGLAAVALSGCGAINVKPAAPAGSSTLVSRGKIDDPRIARVNRVSCLRKAGVSVREVGASALQVGAPSVGPYVNFEPTPGGAQFDQISGRYPGAEVIGSALLFPNHAPDALLSKVEACIGQGVSG